MVRRGWLIVGEPLLAIRRFSTGGPTETYRRRPMTLVGHWWADSDKPMATCHPLPPLAHQSNAIWVETLRTPEPGFSRYSPNSQAGFFPRLSELLSQVFPKTLRTPEPGYSLRLSELPNRAFPETIRTPELMTWQLHRVSPETYLILQTKCLPRLY